MKAERERERRQMCKRPAAKTKTLHEKSPLFMEDQPKPYIPFCLFSLEKHKNLIFLKFGFCLNISIVKDNTFFAQ